MSGAEKRAVNILGTRGVPAAHGGFETFAEKLAFFLRDRGWEVAVYCQDGITGDGQEEPLEEMWEGIRLIRFSTKRSGPVGTIEFDLKCAKDVPCRPGVDLVLGYNTAVFSIYQRLRGRRVLMNMDGIEWKRKKWSLPAKIWFFFNEIIGANMCHIPIADHPEIARHTSRRTVFGKPVMIPYGSHRIDSAPTEAIEKLGLQPDRYFVSIARIEPENSILEMVRAFSRADTDMKCVVLGNFDENNDYHRKVLEMAGEKFLFPGAIYDSDVVEALRFHCRAYFHGHQVGGTNPSLVEALGAGNAIVAHDNKFNRWTAGSGHFYFQDVDSCAVQINKVAYSDDLVMSARAAARKRHGEVFKWEYVLGAYEKTLLDAMGRPKNSDASQDRPGLLER